MSRKGQSVTLSISEDDKRQLMSIAQEQGMLWGDKPNISRLVEAIARQDLLIARNHDWSSDRIRALQQAIRALIDSGQIEYARTLTELLIERREISSPLRAELQSSLQRPIAPWRIAIDQYIQRQIPFELAYRDAADRAFRYTIHFAQICFRERREYLECWCEETEGNLDVPELRHNWTFRLDRIPDAALGTTRGKWRTTGLDKITVEMHLSGRLAFAYESRPEDIVNEWIEDQPQVRRVVRNIANTFWFYREVLPYGEDCVVVSPDPVRSRLQEKIAALSDRYA
ncbi:helix-turn-helix transcriptional regulator [Leptolyngbya sp. AN02str]|uniref:helix-turn-helix transcriptional regulator n=1 Tax=Leptolyngbya sp. AN02str TaxID=3423363 RepID=UPI003D31CF9F